MSKPFSASRSPRATCQAASQERREGTLLQRRGHTWAKTARSHYRIPSLLRLQVFQPFLLEYHEAFPWYQLQGHPVKNLPPAQAAAAEVMVFCHLGICNLAHRPFTCDSPEWPAIVPLIIMDKMVAIMVWCVSDPYTRYD